MGRVYGRPVRSLMVAKAHSMSSSAMLSIRPCRRYILGRMSARSASRALSDRSMQSSPDSRSLHRAVVGAGVTVRSQRSCRAADALLVAHDVRNTLTRTWRDEEPDSPFVECHELRGGANDGAGCGLPQHPERHRQPLLAGVVLQKEALLDAVPKPHCVQTQRLKGTMSRTRLDTSCGVGPSLRRGKGAPAWTYGRSALTSAHALEFPVLLDQLVRALGDTTEEAAGELQKGVPGSIDGEALVGPVHEALPGAVHVLVNDVVQGRLEESEVRVKEVVANGLEETGLQVGKSSTRRVQAYPCPSPLMHASQSLISHIMRHPI